MIRTALSAHSEHITAGRRVENVRADAYRVPMSRPAAERTCVHDACTTRLSRYNPSPFCSIHEGHPAEPDTPRWLADPGARHAETRPWDATLFRPSTKDGRGRCSRTGCTEAAVWAWLEQRPGFTPTGWQALCDDHLPYTADQLAADRALTELTSRLHAAERSQRDRIITEEMAAKGITWPPPDRRPICIGCDHPIHYGEDHSRLLRVGADPVLVHADCATADVLTEAGYLVA